MKRLIGLILSAALLLSLCACGAPENSKSTTPAQQEQNATIPQTTPATQWTEEPIQTPEAETQLVDNDNCAFSLESVTRSDYAGMELTVLCTNKTDRTLMFAWTDVSVCGYQYDPVWSQEVGPGEQVASVIDLDTYRLELWGITDVDQIGFTLTVFDSADFMAQPFVDEALELYPTGKTAYVRPDRKTSDGAQTMAADGGVELTIVSFQDDSDGYTLELYLENTTDRDQVFYWDEVCVNGIVVDPMWSELVGAGLRAYGQVSFPAEGLAEAGVDVVEAISFRLVVTEEQSGETTLEQTCTFHPEQSAVG